MKHALSLIALFAALPAFAQDNTTLDAHEHGVGALNIAFEGQTVAMEFEAPGADIVGFEYEATSDEDLAAIDAALTLLGAPLDLFAFPEAAGCSVTKAHADLETSDEHDEDGHEEGHDKDDEHGHEDKHEADHKEDHGEDHKEEASHTAFHAEYTLTCDDLDAIGPITFSYFESFPNALEVEVQIITSAGAQAFEVERDSPVLELGR